MTKFRAAFLLLILLPALAFSRVKEIRIMNKNKSTPQLIGYEPQWRKLREKQEV